MLQTIANAAASIPIHTAPTSAPLTFPAPPVVVVIDAPLPVLVAPLASLLAPVLPVGLPAEAYLPNPTSLLDPTAAAEPPGASDARTPEAVVAVPTGTSVCPAMMKWERESAVKVWSPRVSRSGAFVGWSSGNNVIVDEPTMTYDAEGARLMAVPETVIGGPPGRSVWPAMTMEEPAVMGVPATVKTRVGVGMFGMGYMVLEPMMR
jgi:hypothetical protein